MQNCIQWTFKIKARVGTGAAKVGVTVVGSRSGEIRSDDDSEDSISSDKALPCKQTRAMQK